MQPIQCTDRLTSMVDHRSQRPQESLAGYLSLPNHYVPFLEGRLNTDALVYYVLFIVTFLALTIRRLDADRLGG